MGPLSPRRVYHLRLMVVIVPADRAKVSRRGIAEERNTWTESTWRSEKIIQLREKLSENEKLRGANSGSDAEGVS